MAQKKTKEKVPPYEKINNFLKERFNYWDDVEKAYISVWASPDIINRKAAWIKKQKKASPKQNEAEVSDDDEPVDTADYVPPIEHEPYPDSETGEAEEGEDETKDEEHTEFHYVITLAYVREQYEKLANKWFRELQARRPREDFVWQGRDIQRLLFIRRISAKARSEMLDQTFTIPITKLKFEVGHQNIRISQRVESETKEKRQDRIDENRKNREKIEKRKKKKEEKKKRKEEKRKKKEEENRIKKVKNSRKIKKKKKSPKSKKSDKEEKTEPVTLQPDFQKMEISYPRTGKEDEAMATFTSHERTGKFFNRHLEVGAILDLIFLTRRAFKATEIEFTTPVGACAGNLELPELFHKFNRIMKKRGPIQMKSVRMTLQGTENSLETDNRMLRCVVKNLAKYLFDRLHLDRLGGYANSKRDTMMLLKPAVNTEQFYNLKHLNVVDLGEKFSHNTHNYRRLVSLEAYRIDERDMEQLLQTFLYHKPVRDGFQLTVQKDCNMETFKIIARLHPNIVVCADEPDDQGQVRIYLKNYTTPQYHFYIVGVIFKDRKRLRISEVLPKNDCKDDFPPEKLPDKIKNYTIPPSPPKKTQEELDLEAHPEWNIKKRVGPSRVKPIILESERRRGDDEIDPDDDLGPPPPPEMLPELLRHHVEPQRQVNVRHGKSQFSSSEPEASSSPESSSSSSSDGSPPI